MSQLGLKPPFEEEFPQETGWSENAETLYRQGEISAAQAASSLAVAHEVEQPEVHDVEYERPSVATPVKNSDAGGFQNPSKQNHLAQ